MKKILIIHNKYQQTGGEDLAVENEIKVLSKSYEVDTLIFDNNIDRKLSTYNSLLLLTNYQINKKLKKKIKDFQPDLVYVHNTWFKISLGIFKILEKENLNTVIKLHNFRYYCTRTFLKKIHLENEKYCNACGAIFNEREIINKYYDSSFIKSILVNNYGRKYMNILKNEKFIKIVLTNHHKEFLIKNNISQNIIVIPNFIPIINTEKSIISNDYIVYAGRVSSEKGLEELIESFINSNHNQLKLKIVGNGPLLELLTDKYKDDNVEFLGELDNKKTLNIILNAKAVITATKLFEGQPTLLCEASALGKTSIFPKTGGIGEFFPENYIFAFEQFNYSDLIRKIELLNDSNLVNKQGTSNKIYLNNMLNEKKLLNFYDSLMNE